MATFIGIKTVICPDCESAHVVKIGTRNGYQRYLCRACSKKFHITGKAAGRRFEADQMGAAVRLFYSGMSYKRTAESMEKMFDIPEPSKATVYEWVRDYTKDALKEMERHPAHTGGHWVVDDKQLDVAGQKYWNWNVMDESTGYLLASHLTKERDALAAEAVLKKAAAAAAEPPRRVKTARRRYYFPAMKKVFPDARHIQSPWVRDPANKTDLSERVQDRFRQRTKTLQGLGSMESAQRYLDGWTLTYNLFRDHESIDDKPPHQAAKVNPPFNEWADLVKGRALPNPELKPRAISKHDPIPEDADVAPARSSDSKYRRRTIPDGVDIPNPAKPSPKRSSGRRRTPAALKQKSGHSSRGPGAKSSKSRFK